MKKRSFSTLSVAITTLLFISCSKDPENPPCTTTSAAIAGSYKVTAFTYKVNSTAPEIDYFKAPYTEPCDKDDIITFNANGTFQSVDAGIVCSPPNGNNGTWELSGTTSFQLDGDDLILESFDCKNLILVAIDAQVTGDKSKLTLTKQ